MKLDADLQRDVLDELKWEPSVNEEDIGVTVRGGVVTLTGNVPTYTEKFAAERATKRVDGVRAVAEELKVKLSSSDERDDTDIAQAAAYALDWNVFVPHNKVKATVENAWITLSGDIEWNYQREAAHDVVRHLLGVKGVTNRMKVESPSLLTVEVRSKIEAAFKRNMMKDADGISVEAHDGRVKLHGKVQSWEEHDDAGIAAWSAPGVTEVENEIEVTY
ncbi:MAG: BON domain-containing protein [Chloroflexota bacterium]